METLQLMMMSFEMNVVVCESSKFRNVTKTGILGHCKYYTVPRLHFNPFQIRTFKAEGCNPERWVKYEINYKYRVQMFPDLSID